VDAVPATLLNPNPITVDEPPDSETRVAPPHTVEWVLARLRIVATEVVHQHGILLLREAGHRPGASPRDPKRLHGVPLLDRGRLRGDLHRGHGHPLGHQRGIGRLRGVVDEMVGEHRPDGRILLGHREFRGMIRPKLRHQVSGVHLLLGYAPPYPALSDL
jgi:hypothetical protein